MRSSKARTIRRAVKREVRNGLDSAWRSLVSQPVKVRAVLAWRLLRGVGMDGGRIIRISE